MVRLENRSTEPNNKPYSLLNARVGELSEFTDEQQYNPHPITSNHREKTVTNPQTAMA